MCKVLQIYFKRCQIGTPITKIALVFAITHHSVCNLRRNARFCSSFWVPPPFAWSPCCITTTGLPSYTTMAGNTEYRPKILMPISLRRNFSTYAVVTIQYFLCELGMKPRMQL